MVDPQRLQQRGAHGAMWRLVQMIDHDENAIKVWLEAERRRGTLATDSATALGEVMATMVMSFAESMGDLQGAINGEKGVLKELQRSLQEKLIRMGIGQGVINGRG
jgi:hypothetical protein